MTTTSTAPTPAEPLTAMQAAEFRDVFEAMAANIDRAVLGKQHVVRLALTCLVSGGHLLLEDFPGTGKTMLARAMASTVATANSASSACSRKQVSRALTRKRRLAASGSATGVEL